MAATLIQTVFNTTASGTSVGVAITPGSPNHSLIAYARCTPIGRTITVADNVNAGNYNQDKFANGLGLSAGIFSYHGVAGSSTTVTATQSGAAAGMGIVVEEWSGLLMPTPTDKTAGANGTAAPPFTTASTGTLSAAPELAVSSCALVSNNTGVAVTAPFIVNLSPATINTSNYQPATTAAITATWNWTNTQGFSVLLVTYQIAPTSVQPTPLYHRRNVLYFT